MDQLVDIIIPAHNEEGNVEKLGDRIIKALRHAGISFNLIFVDDYSTDNTVNEIAKLARKYSGDQNINSPGDKNSESGQAETVIDSANIKLLKKTGPRGKAYAILEGVRASKSPYVAMIDADLQYPPEAIIPMLDLAKEHGMSVANRKHNKVSLLRKIGSRLNSLVFEKLLLDLNCDSQSGLKVFKREIIENLDPNLVTPWTLDMPLLLTATDMGYKTKSYDIEFAERSAGVSKVNFVKTGIEIAKSAIKLKFRKRKIFRIEPDDPKSLIGAGISYRGKRFITHTKLSPDVTAINTFVPWQEFFAALVVSLLIAGILIDARLTTIMLIGLLSISYFIDLIFSAFILNKSLTKSPEIKIDKSDIEKLKDKDLPIYTILCPLYKEAEVLPDFIDAIKKLDWPKEKLDVILLLEEDDKNTQKAAENLNLPEYFRTLVVPDSLPKTKPKACNYGLAFTKGEYVVIYDAEDKPDPLQLKKAFIAFKKAKGKVVCLQCKLNYYNPDTNLLTKLFTAEYTLWFELILPGFQSLSTTIPLGGTSNHFRTRALKYLDGWDPFNVTEDCDLGTRLFKNNFHTAVVDSTTYEEANSRYKSWIKQRSRWIKGYMQTYLVHMRSPLKFYREYGVHSFIFQAVTGMRMVFAMINPILWATTIAYFAFRPVVGDAIESIYPAGVFYLAAFSAVFGNFFYLYIYMIACAKKEYWWLIKYVFFIPFYWAMASIASLVAFYQLITKPHYWEKTTHGLNLTPSEEETIQEVQSVTPEPQYKPAVSPAVLMNSSAKPGRLSQLLSSGFVGGSVLIAASLVASFLNFFYNAYLGRVLKVDDFGTINLFNNFYTIAAVFAVSLTATISYKNAYILGKYGRTIKAYWVKLRSQMWSYSVGATLLWLLGIPLLQSFFNTDSYLPFLIFTPIWVVLIVGSVDAGFLTGNLKFLLLSILTLVTPTVKVLLTIVLVRSGLNDWVYIAIPGSLFAAFVIGWFAILKLKDSGNSGIDKKEFAFPSDFFAASIITKLSSVAFLSFDVILAKHYLPPKEAGEYALLSLAGKIIFFLGSLFGQFINPLISKHEGANEKSEKTFYSLLLGSTLASLVGFIFVGVFGKTVAPLLFGSNINPVIPLLTSYGLGMVAFTFANAIVFYHQIKKEYFFPMMGFAFAILEIYAISKSSQSVSSIANAFTLTCLLYSGTILFVHVIQKPYLAIRRNLKDMFGLFGQTSNNGNGFTNEKLRILIFNWRDKKHTWAGGAEVYIHEIAKRFVTEGHLVTIFCGQDNGNPENEKIEGVNIVRRGGFYTVYLWAALYYIFKFQGKYDVIIDCENGIPFFTPLYSRIPKVLLIHHVHKDIILKDLKLPYYLKPAAYVAKWLESVLMPIVYKNTQIVTVSRSTRVDLVKLGFKTSKDIWIANPGVETQTPANIAKTKYPSFLYLGRLQNYKNIDVAIRAFAKIADKYKNAKLTIAGYGESEPKLQKLTEELGLQNKVLIVGRVTDQTRNKLYASSWASVQPSSFEGWGITVTEANSFGTPVIASNVNGLKDSVVDQKTGILVSAGDVEGFSRAMEKIISDSKFRKELSQNALNWSKKFSWENSAEVFMRIFEEELSRANRFMPSPKEAVVYADQQ